MMESRYVADCDCYLPEIEPLEGASVPSQADIFGVSGTVAERPDGYDPLALPALQPHLTDSYAYQGVVLAVFMVFCYLIPLLHSRTTVLDAVPWLSHGISHPTCSPACAPFTPSKSG